VDELIDNIYEFIEAVDLLKETLGVCSVLIEVVAG